MTSKNGKAAERAQLNEADMENTKAPSRSGRSTHARRCGRTGQAKEKTPVTPKVGSRRETEDEVARLRGEGLEDV